MVRWSELDAAPLSLGSTIDEFQPRPWSNRLALSATAPLARIPQ